MKQEATDIQRTNALHALYGVLDTGNALSRCQAVRAIERLRPHDAESRRRLIGLLNDPDPDVRTDTAAALGNMEIGEATATLLDTLRKDHEGDVRIQAVIALSKIKSLDAVEPLIECFKADGYPELDYLSDDMEYSPCWEIQSQAMEALGQIRDHRATQPLIEVLESGQYDDLQESGFKVLAQLNEDKTRAFLVQQLSHARSRTRRRAAQALGSLFNHKGMDRSPPQEIVNALAGALMDSDSAVRISAAQALAGVDDPTVAAALSTLIADPDAEVRAAVATILGKMKGPDVLERLHSLLEDQDPKLKRSVVCVLGEIGDGRSREPLIRLLDTQDKDLLYEVLRSLGRIGASGTEQQLAQILSSQDMHFAVRSQAAEALGNILSNALAPAEREDKEEAKEYDTRRLSPKHVLAATVFDENERLGCASLSALVNAYPDEAVAWLSDIVLGRPLVLLRERQLAPDQDSANDEQQQEPKDEVTEFPLITGDDPETSTLASIVIGLPGDKPKPASSEGSRADTPTAAIQVFAARLLGGVAAPATLGVDALIEAYQSGDKVICREAVLALGHIGDEAALPVVFEALDSTHPDVRLAAVDVLKEFQMPSGAQERIDLLCTDPDPNLRCAAIAICALGSGPVAKDCLYRALGDEDQQVCLTALNNLTRDTYSDSCAERILDCIFRFSGELRKEAGAALRRVGDEQGVNRLLELIREPEQEEVHWLCIDALSEFFTGAMSEPEACP